MENLPKKTQSSKKKLELTKNLMQITAKILTNRNIPTQEESNWINKLWEWADKSEIPELKWIDLGNSRGFMVGISRNKEELLNRTQLTIDGQKLVEIPKELGNLTNLVSLNIRRCPLYRIPNEIGNLTNLNFLTIRVAALIEIPRSIGNLTNLITLNLLYNQLQEIPKEIGNLTNLTTLNLGLNQLQKLPKEIINLKNLDSLSMTKNPNLTLTAEQEEWLLKLKENGCRIHIDDNLLKF